MTYNYLLDFITVSIAGNKTNSLLESKRLQGSLSCLSAKLTKQMVMKLCHIIKHLRTNVFIYINYSVQNCSQYKKINMLTSTLTTFSQNTDQN